MTTKEDGLVFPIDKADGKRATSSAGKEIFAVALDSVDTSLGAACRNEKNWRFGYAKHAVKMVEKSAESKENALKIANAGLEWMYENFEFIRDGKTYRFGDAMQQIKGTPFFSKTIKGVKGRQSDLEIEVPYKDTVLRGDALISQIQKWAKYGTIENSCANNLIAAVKNKTWLDLSNQYFVLLGAGSAMGPFLLLMHFGANIIAIDLDREGIWKRLISIASESCGSITFPVKVNPDGLDIESIYKNAGCNLFTQTPEIKDFIIKCFPDKQLVVGGYAYLDGELHVRVSLAMDSIIQSVCKVRKNTAVAYLNTPTQVFFIPEDARKQAEKNYSSFSPFIILMKIISALSMGKVLKKNARKPIGNYSICDGLVVAQGPNYCLAKTLQHWRAIILREGGTVVSSNVAPSTATASVVSNRSFGWAYGGFHHFKPMEVFMQETSNAVMGALLIHDINNTNSISHPSVVLSNPYELFSDGAFHGGVWRNAFTINSIGEVAAMLYFWDQSKPFLLLLIIMFVLYVYFLSH